MTRPLPKVSDPAFRKKRRSLAMIDPAAGPAEVMAAGPSGVAAIRDTPKVSRSCFRRNER